LATKLPTTIKKSKVKIGMVTYVAQARGMRHVGSGKIINPTNVT
jgi:Icc-related predicted phosphoesterase